VIVKPQFVHKKKVKINPYQGNPNQQQYPPWMYGPWGQGPWNGNNGPQQPPPGWGGGGPTAAGDTPPGTNFNPNQRRPSEPYEEVPGENSF
jgi:hypothetical protein